MLLAARAAGSIGIKGKIDNQVIIMVTKTLRILALAASMALLQFTLANPALSNSSSNKNYGKPPAPAVSNHDYGAASAAVDFCSSIDRSAGSKYEKAAQKLLPGASNADMAKAKKTSEYQVTYKALSKVFGGLPKDTALSLCRAAL